LPSSDTRVQPTPNVALAPLTTLQVGGAADWCMRATTSTEVEAAYAWARERGLPVFVLGGGSNLVVSDEGIRGLVLRIGIDGIEWRHEGDAARLIAGAGEPWDRFVEMVVRAGYAGLETLSGIPGLVGGTPIQNVGAYGQEVSDTIEHVTAFDIRTGALTQLSASDCDFRYRQSRFKSTDAGRFVVCQVAFHVRRGAPTVTYPDVVRWVEQSGLERATVADVRRGVIAIRRRKGMVVDPADPDTRSVGSFFMNPIVPASTQARLGSPSFSMPDGAVKIPAAWLIERAGFTRGFSIGPVAVSSKHPLAIVNRGGATSADIINLACRIKHTVFDRFGIALRPEPVFAGFGDDERVAFLQRDSL
jgi:UDP-N-acetylmuramate dehydrogenase